MLWTNEPPRTMFSTGGKSIPARRNMVTLNAGSLTNGGDQELVPGQESVYINRGTT